MNIKYGAQKIEARRINYGRETCRVYLAINFLMDHKTYYIVEREIDLSDPADDSGYAASYGFPVFDIDKAELSDSELRDVLVQFLAEHKLYLHSYTISGNRSYIGYNSSSEKVLGELQYQPATAEHDIFVKAFAQTENDVDYDGVFDMRIKGPVKSLSSEQLSKIGYVFKDYVSFSMTTLLSEDEMPKEMLALAEFKREAGDFMHGYQPD